MEMPDKSVNLCGKLLIAMPGMGDPRFDKSVVYMCAHSDDGAMGLIINKPTPQVTFTELLKQLEIEATGGETARIYFGGPVELGRGFVLHSADYSLEDMTLQVDEQFGMTATRDVLTDIAKGEGPKAALLTLGYSGWGPGQLDQEILANGWLHCAADDSLVFDNDLDKKWERAMAKVPRTWLRSLNSAFTL